MTTVEFDQLQHAFELAASKNGPDREDYIRQLAIRDPVLANEVTTLLALETDGDDPLERTCENGRPTVLPSLLIQRFPRSRAMSSSGESVLADRPTFSWLDRSRPGKTSPSKSSADTAWPTRNAIASTRRLRRWCASSFPMSLPSSTADRPPVAGSIWLRGIVAGVPIDQAASKLLAENFTDVVDLFAKVAETLARVHRQASFIAI